ncbi:MAG: choice-of-anchor L domain-containing protein [Flavobacteriales bacterium]|nr:choice-of-anchor L domain-containing protein [Flavobacteriales bacterium]
MRSEYILLPIAALTMQVASAQLSLDTTLTPTELVQTVLVGPGITASNVQFNDLAGEFHHPQIGRFGNGQSVLGWTTGVILATGDVRVARGPNNSPSATLGGGNFGMNDPDLDALGMVATNDRAVLQLDFVPTGNSLQLLYAFASEEYPEYVCGSVNDVLGIFLSGPGISGPFTNNAINLAVVPGSNIPVCINSINPGVIGSNGVAANCAAVDPNWQGNNIYYLHNSGNHMQFDGRTVGLLAYSALEAGLTYHLKIAIADGGDTAFDSAVFLAANSFSSDGSTGAPTAMGGAYVLNVAVSDGRLVVDDLPSWVDALVILDGTGRVVSTHPVAQGDPRALVPVQGMAAGLYFLHITGRSGDHRAIKFLINDAR